MLSLHFDKRLISEISSSWSLTLYDTTNFKVNNSLGCFRMGEKDSLFYNRDGSCDIYVQTDHPGRQKQYNWLVPPEGSFFLVMRLSWPTELKVADVTRPDKKHSILRQ